MPDRMRDPLMSGTSGSLDLGPVESQDVFVQPLPLSWQNHKLLARSQPDGSLSITFQVRPSYEAFSGFAKLLGLSTVGMNRGRGRVQVS